MATAKEFPEQNFKFIRPAGMTEEECGDLPVYMDGQEIVSCWELSGEELDEVKRTGCVWLMVFGQITPPVCVLGVTPFVHMADGEVQK